MPVKGWAARPPGQRLQQGHHSNCINASKMLVMTPVTTSPRGEFAKDGNFAEEGEFTQDGDFSQEGNVAEESGSIATA
jgi:hypothetical protein